MILTDYHDMINAFSADRADEPFCMSVLPRRARGRRSIPDPQRSDAADEYLAVGCITIPDEISRRRLPANGLSELIGDPLRSRMRSHPNPQHLPAAMPMISNP
jgi:hypothetical protein